MAANNLVEKLGISLYDRCESETFILCTVLAMFCSTYTKHFKHAFAHHVKPIYRTKAGSLIKS